MDSQRTVDHLRDEANVRKDTTLGDLLDQAAEQLDEYEFALSPKPRFVWQSLDGKPHFWDRDTDRIPKRLEYCNESVWLVPGTGDDE